MHAPFTLMSQLSSTHLVINEHLTRTLLLCYSFTFVRYSWKPFIWRTAHFSTIDSCWGVKWIKQTNIVCVQKWTVKMLTHMVLHNVWKQPWNFMLFTHRLIWAWKQTSEVHQSTPVTFILHYWKISYSHYFFNDVKKSRCSFHLS